jgi:hypothetical protein
MLQQGHCIPSHFKKISHVVQRFCPNSYLEQLSLPGFEHLYFAHTPLQPIKKNQRSLKYQLTEVLNDYITIG